MTAQHPNVYWTADRSALVEEGDARAAFLAYAGADPISSGHLSLMAAQRSDDIEPFDLAVVKPAPVKRAPRPTSTRKPRKA